MQAMFKNIGPLKSSKLFVNKGRKKKNIQNYNKEFEVIFKCKNKINKINKN